MSQVRLLKAVDSAEYSPRPKLIGFRGCTNEGLDLAFDKPVVLVAGEAGSLLWRVPWINLGEALQDYAEKEARKR